MSLLSSTNLLIKGYTGNIFLWPITFEPLICKSDFNIICLLQSMTAGATQNPKINSLRRCCRDRFSEEWNIKTSTRGFLVLKNLEENRIIRNRSSAIFIPNCKLGSRQPFVSATSFLRDWIWTLFILYALGKGASWVLSAFGAFHFLEGPLTLPFDIFGLLHLQREGGRGTKLARTSLIWASLVLVRIEWQRGHVG